MTADCKSVERCAAVAQGTVDSLETKFDATHTALAAVALLFENETPDDLAIEGVVVFYSGFDEKRP